MFMLPRAQALISDLPLNLMLSGPQHMASAPSRERPLLQGPNLGDNLTSAPL